MPAATQVSLPVIVPERARVFPFLYSFQAVQWAPWAFRPFCLGHKKSLVGGTEIYPELTVMIAQSRCPRASRIMTVRIPPRQIKPAVNLSHNTPVHQVMAFQKLHAYEVEVGRHHIVFLSHPHHVRVGVVGTEHRIDVSTIALVTPAPLSLTPCDRPQAEKRKD